jgi:hypothetical protein
MACLLPRSCTLSVPSTVAARARSNEERKIGLRGAAEAATYCPIFASSAMQLRNTMRPHSTPASEQWKGRQIE